MRRAGQEILGRTRDEGEGNKIEVTDPCKSLGPLPSKIDYNDGPL